MNKLSIGTSKEYRAVNHIIKGDMVKIEVEPYKFDIRLVHKDNLEVLTSKLELYSTLIQKNGMSLDIDDTILVEIKDKSVIKWVKALKAPSKYSKEFVRFLKALDSIPNLIHFVYMEEPIASQYATEYDYNKGKEKLSSGLDDLLLIEDN